MFDINNIPARLDHFVLASAPLDEECVQVSRDMPYLDAMKLESIAFRDQMKRISPPPKGCTLELLLCHHDFGDYYTVAAFWPRDDEAGAEWGFGCEEKMPLEWDDEARKFLNKEQNT